MNLLLVNTNLQTIESTTAIEEEQAGCIHERTGREAGRDDGALPQKSKVFSQVYFTTHQIF